MENSTLKTLLQFKPRWRLLAGEKSILLFSLILIH